MCVSLTTTETAREKFLAANGSPVNNHRPRSRPLALALARLALQVPAPPLAAPPTAPTTGGGVGIARASRVPGLPAGSAASARATATGIGIAIGIGIGIGTGCGNFDISFVSFSTYHQLFTTLHTPYGVLYLGIMALGC